MGASRRSATGARRRAAALAGLVSLVGLSGAGVGQAQASTDGGRIVSGVVRDAVTSQPLAGVCVTTSTVAQTCAETGVLTDADGAFRVSGAGFTGTAAWLTLVPADGDGFHVSTMVDVALTGDETTTVVDLAPAGAISGVALDAVTNTPVAGVCPQAAVPRKHYQFVDWARPYASVTCSDARGVWSLSRLPVGKVVVTLTEPSHRASFVPVAASADKARRFSVKAGRTLRAPVVPLAPGARLTLRAHPDERVLVSVGPAKGGDLNRVRVYEAEDFEAAPDGELVIADLAPGPYRIIVSRPRDDADCSDPDDVCSRSPEWFWPTGYDPGQARNVTLNVANPVTAAIPHLGYREPLTLTFPDIPEATDVAAEFFYPSGARYYYPTSDSEEYLDPGESLGLTYLPDVPLRLRITALDEGDNVVAQWWYGGGDEDAAALIPTSTTQLTLPLPTS